MTRTTNSQHPWWAVTSMLAGALLSAAIPPQQIDAADYVNPCSERGVADQLNALYNDPVGPNEKCSTEDGQSYKCSGVIIRGGDAGRPDRTYQGTGSGLAAFGTTSIVDPPNYTIGIES